MPNLADPPPRDKPKLRRCLACNDPRTAGCFYDHPQETRWFCRNHIPEEFQWIDRKAFRIQRPSK